MVLSGAVGVAPEAVLEHAAPAVVVVAPAGFRRGDVAQRFPARMGEPHLGASGHRRELDRDLLRLLRREVDQPAERETARRIPGQDAAPLGLAAVLGALIDAAADAL